MRGGWCIAGVVVWALGAAGACAEESAASAGVEFFEKRVRPLLAEHCYHCHGGEKHENDLFLNSPRGIAKGGDRGPAFVAGKPDDSVLVQAVRYTDDDLKMPPRGKLADEQIADLVKWVEMGALLPPDDSASPAVVIAKAKFDLQERRQHWSYQPVKANTPPAVKDGEWPTSPIDPFILHKLEAAELSPASPADRRTLIRRLTFDLTGLPATPDEVAAFLADDSPDAIERLIDRLLASPAYGERWARHWLDVVRYSETLGFEFDYDLYNAWRYRDYVIRAFNADLPYDQFVIEHLAGDLVPRPRRAADGCNESILATGFFWMMEGKQTPVDIRQEQADRIDNQIDTLGKAFLGQTIACARCHDHKFDAISTRDYYALAGYLRSSRFQQAFIDPQERFAGTIAELQALRKQIAETGVPILVDSWRKQLSQASRYLMAAHAARTGMSSTTAADAAEAIRSAVREHGVDGERLQRWVKALADESLSGPEHPLFLWGHESKSHPEDKEAFERAFRTPTRIEFQERLAGRHAFADFMTNKLDGHFITGAAFASSPSVPGEIVIGELAERPIGRITTGGADSGTLAIGLQGEVRSPTFTIDKPFLHIRMSGQNTRVNLVIDGNTLIMNPMYGKLTAAPDGNLPVWRTMPVDRWIGRRAYLEFSDCTIPMHRLNPPASTARVPAGQGDGYIGVEEIVLSSESDMPAGSLFGFEAWRYTGARGLAGLAEGYQQLMLRALDRWQQGEAPWRDDLMLLNWLLENGLLDEPVSDGELAELLRRYRELAAGLPTPQRAPALADGTGEDEFIFLRGNHRTPGEKAPRRPPQALTVSFTAPQAPGSGRLELARSLASADNPLLARVIVNRLWQHHFGAGIVRTPDDFGRMGQPPSHPDLLDFLASEFVRANWSIKAMHRRMVNSTTYRMASIPHSAFPTPHTADPDNRLLWRMPVRRLEAEAIRDTILAVSGRLDRRLHGPSVLPFLTPHMEGRGKPQSGPLDGEGRRSIYINARRNFLTPLLLAFDYPVTFTPIGRRGNSAIPAQALTLMNDPFVVQQAGQWAQQVLRDGGTTADERIESLYAVAFSRPPTDHERHVGREFLEQQAARHGTTADDERVWTDLCHVLINVKEFIFID